MIRENKFPRKITDWLNREFKFPAKLMYLMDAPYFAQISLFSCKFLMILCTYIGALSEQRKLVSAKLKILAEAQYSYCKIFRKPSLKYSYHILSTR